MLLCKRLYFNPRSREGSDLWDHPLSLGYMNFNPRSREGSDIVSMTSRVYAFISIHAPVKGATSDPRRYQGTSPISIHAPVKGATVYSLTSGHLMADFNPRSREGSDLSVGEVCPLLVISIHAPVKGATKHKTKEI